MSELIKALVAARKEIGGAKKGSVNPAFRSKYADLAAVIDAVKDPLEAHGLTFVQDIVPNEQGQHFVVTVILHESGETMKLAGFPIVATKPDAQGHGSALTYARRYSLQTALGVPAEDDDGNAASKPAKEAKEAKFPSPVTSAMEGVKLDETQTAKVAKVANALVDFHALMQGGADTGYQAFETIETLTHDEQLAVWSALAQHSRVRAWIKTVLAEPRKAAA
jgi:hypothetical protein